MKKSVDRSFEGYPVEIDYTFGYYRALSPGMLRLATLNQFVQFPSRRPLRYLELGYGNGVSLNIHAAASPGDYWGTDINSSHAHFANILAENSGSSIHALCAPFAELLSHRELPDFDVIVAHGVWSWISNSNRHAIIKLLRSKLVEGGIFYISYNALPGAAAVIPLQQFIKFHSERCSPEVAILRGWATRFGYEANSVDRLTWAVEVASRRMPGATCLCRALALQHLLARNGHGSELRIGVEMKDGRFGAHAWLVYGARILIGGSQLGNYDLLCAWQVRPDRAESDPNGAARL